MGATAIETIEITVDGAPAKEMLGLGNRHWRWEHTTRENYTRRVASALDDTDLEPGTGETLRLASVHVDWGTTRPMLDDTGIRALFREVARALMACGITIDQESISAITQAQSGIGRGTTTVVLEPVSVE